MKLHNNFERTWIFWQVFSGLTWCENSLQLWLGWGPRERDGHAATAATTATASRQQLFYFTTVLSHDQKQQQQLECWFVLYLCFRTWKKKKERETSDKWKSELGLDKKLVKLLSWSAQKRSKLGLGKRLFSWKTDKIICWDSDHVPIYSKAPISSIFSNTLI